MAWDIANYPFNDEQWHRMCNAHIDLPVPLHEADLTTPWVYYRPWGLMNVPSGHHQHAMATLYAFHNGYADYMALGKALDIPAYRWVDTLADCFLLEVEGTAFLSSAGKSVTVGSFKKLDAHERQAFRAFNIQYLED